MSGLEVPVAGVHMVTVDTYLRSRVKLELAHLPLTICGEGWERHKVPGQRARFLPAIAVAEAIAAMRRSRIVLNPLPP